MFSLEPAYRHTWLIWATSFLVPWAVLFIFRPKLRSRMALASLLTAPFGLTEPLYWSSVYEHIAWRQHGAKPSRIRSAAGASPLRAEIAKPNHDHNGVA